MRVLILSQEPPFDPEQVATGNALRTAQLRDALERGGHDTEQAWLDRDGGPDRFRSADELRALIQRRSPDVLLVAYWELLELLPFDPPAPVVVDFLAPRPLEVLFEAPEKTGGTLRRLRVALGRADLLLVASEDQRTLLAYWLLEAGFDLRETEPVVVVPLAAPLRSVSERPDPSAGLRLVSGGVRWPWRQDEACLEAVREAVGTLVHDGHPVEFLSFDGGYRWHEGKMASTTSGDGAPTTGALQRYRAWSDVLATAHVGLELGAGNIERRFSHSFRALDFLRHGVPVLCRAGQPLAAAVRDSGAGWVVDGPGEIPGLLRQIVDDPDDWRRRSDAATALALRRHDPETAAAPLLRWMADPGRASRLPGRGLPDPAPPVLGVPPLRERLARRYRLARRVLLHRLLVRHGPPADAVVVVSRDDLFPTDHGAAVKIVETARGVSRHDRPVYIVTHDRGRYWEVRNGEVRSRRLPAWLRLLSRPLAWVKLDHYTRDLPESNAFLYLPLSDGSFFWRTLWVASRHGAGALVAEFPAYALPCLRAGEVLEAPTLLVEHNVEYERLRAQVPALTAGQYETLRAIEIDLCNRADAVVCVSDNDRQRLAADGVHPGRLHTIPHGIDLAAFDGAEPEAVRARFGIAPGALLLAYHGTFAYPPNRDALHQFVEQVLPRLSARGLDAHVLAIGHQPPAGLPANVHCVGSVEQVAPWLKAADVAAVPLREGGGTRMKIIDYFAAGLPVVSTAKGIEGIPATDGESALIRDDWEGFANAIASLAKDRRLSDRLRAGGRGIAEGLDWSAIGERYLRLTDSLRR